MRGREPFTPETVARRSILWLALADLFLDTDTARFHPGIAETIVKAGFAVDEAERILRWDVRPALYWNLLHTAGEWAGWEETWVLARIQEVRRRPPLFCRGPLRRWCRNWYLPCEDWAAIREMAAR